MKQKLPAGWRWVKLTDICEFRHGGTPSKNNLKYWRGSIPWISPKDMKSIILKDAKDHISQNAIENSATGIAPAGSILIVVRSGILARHLPVAMADRDLAFNQDIKAVIPDETLVDSQFLLWQLISMEAIILAKGIKKGSTVHSVKSDYIESQDIALPPLAEQKRIAALLNEQSALVEQARADTESQLDAAESLSAAYLRKVFAPIRQKLRLGWRWMKLKDVCDRIDYGYTESADYSIQQPKFLRITDIQDGRVDWLSVPGCRITLDKEESHRLWDGDIVFARTGGTTGKSYLIHDPPRSVFASYLIRIRPTSQVRSDYLYAFFQSKSYWEQVRAAARGGAQPNVNATLLSRLIIPFAPLIEQKRIAAMLKEQLAATEKLRASLKSQLAEINALPAALLRRAFRGEV